MFNHPDIECYEVEAGDVIFHSLSAPHGSKGNKSKDLRRTFYIHYAYKNVYEKLYKNDLEVIERKKTRKLFFDFNNDSKNKILEMLKIRKSFGLEIPEKNLITISNEGFEFIGEPKTDPFHWKELKNKISANKKKL